MKIVAPTLCFRLLSVLLVAVLAAPGVVRGQADVDWMKVNEEEKTVALNIVAGSTDAFNYWNFNGHAQGSATITVPVGFTVNLDFTNNDPTMAHSIGVAPKMDTYPAMFENPEPAFDGAISSNPTDMMNATKTGESEALSFVASEAGEYVLICYVPGHATVGMYVNFVVSAEGKAGVDL